MNINFDETESEGEIGEEIMNNQKELDQLNAFLKIMHSVSGELVPIQEVNKIHAMDLTIKEKYLKIFELYLDKIIK